MVVLKLERIDGVVAVVLPPEVLFELRVVPGDRVVVEAAPADAVTEAERQIQIAREIIRKNHAVLSVLAKS